MKNKEICTENDRFCNYSSCVNYQQELQYCSHIISKCALSWPRLYLCICFVGWVFYFSLVVWIFSILSSSALYSSFCCGTGSIGQYGSCICYGESFYTRMSSIGVSSMTGGLKSLSKYLSGSLERGPPNWGSLKIVKSHPIFLDPGPLSPESSCIMDVVA